MKRLFIQDPSVTHVLDDGGVNDEGLREVETAILRGAGNTVSGTGGLKKIRCRSAGRGKRGSIRIIFADYPVAGRVYLLAAFGKNEKADLSSKERRDLHALKLILDSFIEGIIRNANRNN